MFITGTGPRPSSGMYPRSSTSPPTSGRATREAAMPPRSVASDLAGPRSTSPSPKVRPATCCAAPSTSSWRRRSRSSVRRGCWCQQVSTPTGPILSLTWPCPPVTSPTWPRPSPSTRPSPAGWSSSSRAATTCLHSDLPCRRLSGAWWRPRTSMSPRPREDRAPVNCGRWQSSATERWSGRDELPGRAAWEGERAEGGSGARGDDSRTGEPMSAQGGTSIHTIVAGVDGSDSSIDALRWAFAEAERTGADLEAITAWQWPLTLGAVAPFAPEYDPAGDAQRMLDDIVAAVAGEFPTVTVRTRSVEGHPSEVLVEASRHAALLVVGSRGHGAFAGAVLGSVSQHCVAHAASPVLVHRQHRQHR